MNHFTEEPRLKGSMKCFTSLGLSWLPCTAHSTHVAIADSVYSFCACIRETGALKRGTNDVVEVRCSFVTCSFIRIARFRYFTAFGAENRALLEYVDPNIERSMLVSLA